MKKPILRIGFYAFLLLLSFSCEDATEGDILPATTASQDLVLTSDTYTHWVFRFDTEGKADGSYHIGTNPDTQSNIHISITDGVVADAWATQSATIAATISTTQTTHSLGLTGQIDPSPGQPFAEVLPQLSGCPYDVFCHPDLQTFQTKCIHVLQPKSRRLCIPQAGEITVYVPLSL